ncbi:MAG: hypothetical protein JWR03_922 [Cohnella sp.]|nr:hypothetical protein [Cohnella sp.]
MNEEHPGFSGSRNRGASRSGFVRLHSIRLYLWGDRFAEKQIVQRTERSILFHLVDRHFFTIDGQFNKAAPAIKLMGTDFSDVFGTAIRASHHPLSPVTFRIPRMVSLQHPFIESGHKDGVLAHRDVFGSFRHQQPAASFEHVRKKTVRQLISY